MPPMIVNSKTRAAKRVALRGHSQRGGAGSASVDAIPRVPVAVPGGAPGAVLPLTRQQIKARRSNPQANVRLSKKQTRRMLKLAVFCSRDATSAGDAAMLID